MAFRVSAPVLILAWCPSGSVRIIGPSHYRPMIYSTWTSISRWYLNSAHVRVAIRTGSSARRPKVCQTIGNTFDTNKLYAWNMLQTDIRYREILSPMYIASSQCIRAFEKKCTPLSTSFPILYPKQLGRVVLSSSHVFQLHLLTSSGGCMYRV